jgi:hypothetical protein
MQQAKQKQMHSPVMSSSTSEAFTLGVFSFTSSLLFFLT